MRLYISADLEGVAGVVSPRQVTASAAYEEARRWMTEEVCAVSRGALAAGAEKIVVNDGHLSMTNLLLDHLPEKVEVLSGRPKEWGMMCSIDKGFDLAFFVGYHARQGSLGLLSHSYSDAIARIELNGIEVGELGFNAALAGFYGVPVGLVSGDAEVAVEGSHLVGTRFAVVKWPLSQQGARTLLPQKSQALLETHSYEVVRDWLSGENTVEAWCPGGPYQLMVEFRHARMAQVVACMPGLTQRGPCRVEYSHQDLPTLYKAFQAMLLLAHSVA
ncbi:M55 family metallopeptidase [Heliorestis convoluta]|uniref:Peptidase m55, d-aminopeptidase, putative n=1 Tax=Heliorestis convoluta TaxID=356322 RepID=A0A5Q2MY75_9FIRM|nr:M55 family metallopeptidase [Heliorestis convoluta]QGG47834.1 peptidase m55, d-aminopeptidase, putative [Heliorestis convoluta]